MSASNGKVRRSLVREGVGIVVDSPIVNIVGEKVMLGPLKRDLTSTYQRWINDVAVARYVSPIPRPWTFEAESLLVEGQLAARTSTPFTIYERSTDCPIGTTEWRDVDYRNHTAEFGILIGETEAHGKGYGTEVTKLMLEFAFNSLGLTNVMLRVFEFNLAGRRAYEKAGFREFGRRHQAFLIGNQAVDEILMECLVSDWSD